MVVEYIKYFWTKYNFIKLISKKRPNLSTFNTQIIILYRVYRCL